MKLLKSILINQKAYNYIYNYKSSCQGSINMVKWKGVDKKRKGGVSNGIYWNYMFDNRHLNLPKSFIKIKIKGRYYYDRNNLQNRW